MVRPTAQTKMQGKNALPVANERVEEISANFRRYLEIQHSADLKPSVRDKMAPPTNEEKQMANEFRMPTLEDLFGKKFEIERRTNVHLSVGEVLRRSINLTNDKVQFDDHAHGLLSDAAQKTYRPRKVYGDGNCLFRSVSMLLTQSEQLHLHLRVATASYICEHGWPGLHPQTLAHQSTILAGGGEKTEGSNRALAFEVLAQFLSAELDTVAFLGAMLEMPILHLHPGVATAAYGKAIEADWLQQMSMQLASACNVLFPPPSGMGSQEPLKVMMCVCEGEKGVKSEAVPVSAYNHYAPLYKARAGKASRVKVRKNAVAAATAAVDPLAQAAQAMEPASVQLVHEELLKLFSFTKEHDDPPASTASSLEDEQINMSPAMSSTTSDASETKVVQSETTQVVDEAEKVVVAGIVAGASGGDDMDGGKAALTQDPNIAAATSAQATGNADINTSARGADAAPKSRRRRKKKRGKDAIHEGPTAASTEARKPLEPGLSAEGSAALELEESIRAAVAMPADYLVEYVEQHAVVLLTVQQLVNGIAKRHEEAAGRELSHGHEERPQNGSKEVPLDYLTRPEPCPEEAVASDRKAAENPEANGFPAHGDNVELFHSQQERVLAPVIHLVAENETGTLIEVSAVLPRAEGVVEASNEQEMAEARREQNPVTWQGAASPRNGGVRHDGADLLATATAETTVSEVLRNPGTEDDLGQSVSASAWTLWRAICRWRAFIAFTILSILLGLLGPSSLIISSRDTEVLPSSLAVSSESRNNVIRGHAVLLKNGSEGVGRGEKRRLHAASQIRRISVEAMSNQSWNMSSKEGEGEDAAEGAGSTEEQDDDGNETSKTQQDNDKRSHEHDGTDIVPSTNVGDSTDNDQSSTDETERPQTDQVGLQSMGGNDHHGVGAKSKAWWHLEWKDVEEIEEGTIEHQLRYGPWVD